MGESISAGDTGNTKATAGAFVGAEGYGASTIGGRGGTVVHVTNLNDSGAGSLRWALEKLDGPRIIVFDVAGTIDLKQNILIENGNVTIAGQTAPGEGITLAGAGIRIKADEVIMRGMNIRPGDGVNGHKADDRDGLMIGTTDFIVNNVVIDHNSFTWGVDENVTINGKVQDVSFTNNIVAEGLSKSIHSKGEHSKGLMISNWGGAADDVQRITVAKNLLSDNMQRNAEIKAGQDIEFINNYIYNYGMAHAGTAIGGGNNGTLKTTVDVIGNVWQPGANTGGTKAPVVLVAMTEDSVVTLSDNLYMRGKVDKDGNQDQSTISYSYYSKGTVSYVANGTSNIGILDSRDVRDYVLANVGAVNANGRNSIDERIVDEASKGTGTIIDKVSQVFAPDAAAKEYRPLGPTDTDRDGMADWFEDLFGLDKRVADDKGDADGDGFTNVEEYINGLIDGFDRKGSRLSADPVELGKGERITAVALDTPQSVLGFLGGTDIDLSAVVKAFDSKTHSLGDFVAVAHAGGDSYISVDTDGVGGSSIKSLIAVVKDAELTLADLTVDPKAQLPDEKLAETKEDVAHAEQPVYDPHIYLTGSAADDKYTVTSELEKVVEVENGGKDLIVTTISYTLDANVENLSMKDGAINGTGNALDNAIAGNNAANILNGLDGNDRLVSGGGDDTLLGGAGADWLEAGLGNDTLVGGAGADVLIGNAGRDFFCFDAGDARATSKSADDRIVDLSAEDCVVVNGQTVDWADVTSNVMLRANYGVAYAAAANLIARGDDMVLINGGRDSWLFWDTDGDHLIDSGVTLTNAATWLTQKATDLPLI